MLVYVHHICTFYILTKDKQCCAARLSIGSGRSMRGLSLIESAAGAVPHVLQHAPAGTL